MARSLLVICGVTRMLFPAFDRYALAIAGVWLLGCSGQADEGSSTSGGGGGAGSSAGNAGDGGSPSGGTAGTRSFTPDPGCRSSSDCPESNPPSSCFRFGDGPGVCRRPSEPVSVCEPHSLENECCPGSDCSEGQCFTIATQPLQCSSTAGVDQQNVCVVDECDSDADCAGGFCTPAGFAPGRSCVTAACSRDADCSAEPGGACALLALGCCGYRIGGGPERDASIACVYPSDGCQLDSDCASGEYCVVRAGRARCVANCP
jgi:hypothetical protein